MKQQSRIIVGILFFCLINQLYAGGKEGSICSTHSDCDSSLACTARDIDSITTPRWSGITISEMIKLLKTAEPFYDSNYSEDDLWQYLKYQDNKITITFMSSNSSSLLDGETASNYPKYTLKYKDEDKEGKPRTRWRIIAKKDFLASSSKTYRKAVYDSATKKVIQRNYTTKKGKLGIEAKHILAFYSKQVAIAADGSHKGSYLNYLENNKTKCNSTTDFSEECELAYQIMDTITGHLSDYRNYIRQYRSNESASIVTLPNLAIVRNLQAEGTLVQGPEYCYSFRISASDTCLAPLKVCSCAQEGEALETSTHQCCSVESTDENPDSSLPLIPDEDNICTAFYMPPDPYGPGDGSTPDYTIDLTSNKKGFAACEYQVNFNSIEGRPDRLVELNLPTSTQEERINSLLTYINNDWLITLSLEYLFNNPVKPDCLRPNFKGRVEDSPGSRVPTFGSLMKDKVAGPLEQARLQGNLSFKQLQTFENEVKSKIQFNCYNIEGEDGENSEQCQANDAFFLGIDSAILKEKKMLAFENSLLYGLNRDIPLSPQEVSEAPGGLARILNCSDTSIQDIDRNPLSDITWLEALRNGYRNIKYNRTYAKKTLGYPFGKRAPHRFSNCRSNLKRDGVNAYTFQFQIGSWGNKFFLIDPPLPQLVGYEIGRPKWVWSADTLRKVSDEIEIKNALTGMLPAYFSEFNLKPGESSDSFLNVGNPELMLKLMGDYTYHFFDLYSHRRKKDGGYNTKDQHLVKSRLERFYGQAEVALEELGYYLNQLAGARANRLECLSAIKAQLTAQIEPQSISYGGPEDSSSNQDNQLNSMDTNLEGGTTSSDFNQNSKGLKNDLNVSTKTITSNINTPPSITGKSIKTSPTSSGDSYKNISSKTTSYSSDSSEGAHSNAYDLYNQQATNRSKNRTKKRQHIYKQVNKKYKDKLKSSSPSSLIGEKSLIEKAFSTSDAQNSSSNLLHHRNPPSNSTASSESDLLNKSANKQGSSEYSRGKYYNTSSGQNQNGGSNKDPSYDYFNGEDGSSFYSGPDGYRNEKNSSRHQHDSPENKKVLAMLEAIKKSNSKYTESENDSLFEKITKSYFRSGYKRLLEIKKKPRP